MVFHIITIFPEIFASYFNESIIKRAQAKGLIKIKLHDLRDWADDRHRTVDDSPYGGGAGMIMKVDVLYRAIRDIKNNESRIMNKGAKNKTHDSCFMIHNSKTVLFSAKGKKWNQALAKKYSKLNSVIMVCGRYEGVDERVKKFVDEEISLGDYVLTGGEIPAMVIVDSVARLLPGVLGNKESAEDESHSQPGILEYPQYTRPEIFAVGGKKYRAPKTLLSGDHGEIRKWREKKMRKV